jgi:hypothetical protein
MCSDLSVAEFNVCWDQTAFAGGFKDGGTVALQVRLHAPQSGYARIKPRELLLNFGSDSPLVV